MKNLAILATMVMFITGCATVTSHPTTPLTPPKNLRVKLITALNSEKEKSVLRKIERELRKGGNFYSPPSSLISKEELEVRIELPLSPDQGNIVFTVYQDGKKLYGFYKTAPWTTQPSPDIWAEWWIAKGYLDTEIQEMKKCLLGRG